MVDYDEAIKYLGDFGKYQRRIYFPLLLAGITSGVHSLAYVFLAAIPEHRCYIPGLDSPDTQYDDIDFNGTLPYDDKRGEYSKCTYYARNYSNSWTSGEVGQWEEVTCDRWVYDTSQYKSTVTMDWDLVCDRSSLQALGYSLYAVGVGIGCVVFGDLSDRFGRKKVLYFNVLLQLVAGVACAFMPEFVSFTITRVILGSIYSLFVTAFVMTNEMVGEPWRVTAGLGFQYAFTVGYCLVGVFAIFIRDWFWLQLALTAPGLLLLPYWWLIPESVRWLLANDKDNEASALIRKAAKVNKVIVPDYVFKQKAERNEEEDASANHVHDKMIDLFRNWTTCKITLNLSFIWFVASLLYYGLSLNTFILAGNDYANFLLMGLCEIPAYAMTQLTTHFFGRRITLSVFMTLGGVACLATAFVPNDITWLITTLAICGKMGGAAAFAIIYQMCAELYPTSVRNSATGWSSCCARIGSLISPFIGLLDKYVKNLPLYIFGVFAVLAGIFGFMLPETRHRALPETILDLEALAR